jgi:hypothetical protein
MPDRGGAGRGERWEQPGRVGGGGGARAAKADGARRPEPDAKGRAFGEAFAPGGAGTRTLWVEVATSAELPRLAGEVAVQLARGEGREGERAVHELPVGNR